MTLQVQLTMKQKTLLYQQDEDLTIVLKNAAKKPLPVPMGPNDVSEPALHLLGLDTGVETEYRRTPAPRAKADEPFDLSPGATSTNVMSILEMAPGLEPGKYEARFSWEYGLEGERAMSNAVAFEVLYSTPAGLAVAPGAAGDGSTLYGAWVDVANDPPSLYRGSFDLEPGGGVLDIVKVGAAPIRCPKAVSAPGTRSLQDGQWVTWLSDGALKFAYVHDDMGATKPQELRLPAADLEIVSPAYCTPLRNTTQVPAGAVLLCLSAPGGAQFRLQTLELSQNGAKPLGAGNLKGRKPTWIRSHVRLSDEWLVTFIQAAGKEMTLSTAHWPGMKQQELNLKELVKWPGEFLAAGATLDAELAVNGAVLRWNHGEDGVRKLEILEWRLSPHNEFEEGELHELEWHPNTPVLNPLLAVADDGTPVALLRDGEGKRHAYDGDGAVLPLSPPYDESKQTVAIGFLNGEDDPLLIWGTVKMGFNVVKLDGSPMPEAVVKY